MNIIEEIIDTETADGPMAVLVKYPDDGQRHPTIAVFQDAPGIRQSIHDFTRRLAAEGYRVVTPDLHHRHGRMLGWEASEATDETRAKVREMLYSMTDDQIQSDLDDALALIDLDDDEKLAVLGFCLGAKAMYRTLMRLPDRFACGATWHPSMLVDDGPDSPHLSAGGLTHPVYIGIGTEDQVQSIEMQQKFFDAVADLDNVEVVHFEGADHGFTWPLSPTYHEAAATTSWDKTTALFATNLK